MSDRSRRFVWRALVIAIALLFPLALPVPANASSGTWRLFDIGAGDYSDANAVNDLGHVVGSRNGQAFLWRHGRFTDLGPGAATDINNRDEVVGYSSTAGYGRAMLWRAGKAVELGTLPGGSYSFAEAINDHGEVVGYSATDPYGYVLHAFRWHNGVMTELGGSPQYRSLGMDINNRGTVVGELDEAAVQWRHNQIITVYNGRGEATAISDSGAVTGLRWGSWGVGGFVWRSGTVTEIPNPSPTPSGFSFLQPQGINNRAQVVGSSSAGAFVWHRGTMTILPNLVSTSVANGINNTGTIAGSSASRPDGLNQHAVIWTR